MSAQFGKAAGRRLTLAAVPRESGAADRLLDNSRQMVRLDQIDDNPRNPRHGADEAGLRELAANIAEHGLLQAPVVRRHPGDPDRYQVVLGARRVAAHRLLGREEIEAIVRRLDDRQAFLASCVENLQRVQLTPREELDLIGVLLDELGSQEAVARALGKSPTWLSKRKRLLAAPALAAAVERGDLSLDHAYDIAVRAPDEAAALAQLARVAGGGQSQDATRDLLAPRRRPGVVSGRNSAGALAPADPGAAPTGVGPAGAADATSRSGQARGPAEFRPETATPIAPAGTAVGYYGDIAAGAEPLAPPADVLAQNHAEARPTIGGADTATSPGDLIDPGVLAIVGLTRGGGRVPRQAALRALRADLAALEGR